MITKHLLKYVLFIFVAGSLSSCSNDVSLQALDDDAIVLAFGDSLTYGTGTSMDKAYPAILQLLIDRKVINAGVPGEISAHGLKRLPRLLQKHRPALIIICHGGNDILRKLDLSKTRDNLQQMINLAKQSNTQVVLIGVPEFGLFLNAQPMYRELADKNQLVIENTVLADIIGNNSLKTDHIHPNTAGYQILAEKISLLLSSAGAIR